jgi:hypothetical protein
LNTLLSNTLENLDKMDKFLDECNQPVLNLKDVNNLNRSIKSNEIESVIKASSQKRAWDMMD